MKIMHVLQSSSFSGAENVVIQIITMLQKQKSVESIYVSSKGTIEDVLIEKGVNYYLFDKLSLRNVTKAIRQYKPDIIHAHDFQASVICAAVKHKEVLVSHIHCNPPWLKKPNLNTLIYLLSNIRINKVLTVSEKISNDYFFRQVIQKKCLNIGNPYSVSKINNQVSDVDAITEFDVAFVGRLEDVKNPLKFIEIIHKIKQHIPHVNVAMVGNGSLYTKCKKLIKHLSLDSNITLFGFQKNPYYFIKKSKMLCITSKNEGYSLVALEAIALSKPVISFDVGELSNIIDETCGVLNNDDEFLANEIINLLKNEDLLFSKSIGAQTKAYSIENYDIYADTLLKTYGN